MSVARDLFEKEELGKMMTNIMVVMGLAAIIFSILGGQIAQYFPWQWLFWIMVYFGSLIFLFTLFFYKETFNEKIQLPSARDIFISAGLTLSKIEYFYDMSFAVVLPWEILVLTLLHRQRY